MYIDTDEDTITSSYGYIETVMAGKANISKDILAYVSDADIGYLGAEVGSWLSTTGSGYGSVGALVNSGDTANIANFIQVFSGSNI